MNEYKEIWVFSEKYNLVLELLAGAHSLSTGNDADTQIAAVLLGSDLSERSNEVMKYGADKVFVVDNPQLKEFCVETYLDVLMKLTSTNNPQVLLIGSTKNGKELASRLATRLGVGCVPDCSQISMSEKGELLTKRMVYSGNAVVTATYQRKPQIATVQSRTFEKLEPKEGSGETVKVEADVQKPKVQVVKVDKVKVADVKIEEARIVVCGGRGLEKKEDFRQLEELAELLGGQVGNTRPLAEDRRWFAGWVGLSGKKVKPALYLGCGLSGVIQHVAGMRDSQIVVAINKDPEAPIFEMADYIVVGDLYEVVPALVAELKKRLKG